MLLIFVFIRFCFLEFYFSVELLIDCFICWGTLLDPKMKGPNPTRQDNFNLLQAGDVENNEPILVPVPNNNIHDGNGQGDVEGSDDDDGLIDTISDNDVDKGDIDNVEKYVTSDDDEYDTDNDNGDSINHENLSDSVNPGKSLFVIFL